MGWNKTPFQPGGFGAVIWLRTKGRSAPLKLGRKAKIGLVLLAAVGGTVGYLTYRETLPKIDGLGSRVSIQVLEEVEGVAWVVSGNGKFVSIVREEFGPPALVTLEGRITDIVDSEESTFASIVFISNSGTARGYRMQKDTVQLFEATVEGKISNLDDRPYSVIAGSADGRVLIGEEIRSPQGPIIVRDGVPNRYPLPSGVTGRFVLKDISADGRSILAEAGDGAMPYALMIEDNKVRTIRLMLGVRPQVLSRNGRYAILESGLDLFLASPGGLTPIYKAKATSADWWTEGIEKIRGLFGVKPPNQQTSLSIQEGLFVSNDGTWAVVSEWTGQPLANLQPTYAWSESSGWVTLAEEIQKRGGRFPAGWSLGGINAVSDDGQTMVGYTVNGKRQAPLILWFSD